MLSNMIDLSYNDDNSPVITFNFNGERVADSVDSLKSWALQQDTFKRIMTGIDSSGAGTNNVSNTSGKPLTLTEQAILANKQNKR